MDFDLSDEHRMLQEMVADFVAKEVRPRSRHLDETGEFPWDALRAMAKLGLLGLTVPEEYGGCGADGLSSVIMLEELGKACGSTALIVSIHLSLGCSPLAAFGTEAQKQRWLVPLAQGKILGCMGLTEAGAGCDLRGIRTTASRDGAGWVINGSKMWLTTGREAGVAILLCRTGNSFSQFLMPTEAPGVEFGSPEKKMGLHASHSYAVSLDDVRLPPESLLGQEGRGLAQALQAMEGARIGIASLSLGLAEAAFETALAYAGTRQAFGRSLREHEAVAFMLADMATAIEAARWLVYRVAWLRDRGRPCNKEACMAKLVATETAERVARDAMQIHGGYGYSAEYPVERIYRDARLMTIGEGTSEMQRLVISRSL